MAFVRREDTLKKSQCFVQKLKEGSFQKDYLTNHGEKFEGGHEDIALSSFVTYISSVSYAMMKLRSGKNLEGNYHGY